MLTVSPIATLALSLALVTAATWASARDVAPATLIRAGKAATVSQVDHQRADCKDGRTIEEWLKEAVGDMARSIRWSGGACLLANKQSPRDAGTKWCAQAVITPKKGGPPTTVETYFEAPKGGRPGKPFAFRASVRTKAGWDYMRETSAFETNWGETYIPGYAPPPQRDDCR
jgi:hypothetical protein